MPDLGWQELAIIAVIVVIIFGAGRLPEIGGALGKSIKEFKASTEGLGEIGERAKATTVADAPAAPQAAVARQVRAEEI